MLSKTVENVAMVSLDSAENNNTSEKYSVQHLASLNKVLTHNYIMRIYFFVLFNISVGNNYGSSMQKGKILLHLITHTFLMAI